jgi:hypothetical protein
MGVGENPQRRPAPMTYTLQTWSVDGTALVAETKGLTEEGLRFSLRENGVDVPPDLDTHDLRLRVNYAKNGRHLILLEY